MAKMGLAVALVVGLIGAGLVGAIPASAQGNEEQVSQPGGSGTNVLINEVEMNPRGRDAGREWVELYNPTSSDINIGNFAVQTQVRPSTITIPAGTVIGAGQFYVVKVEGERFAIVETLALVDSSGRTVDTTPSSLLDRRDDARTWQRMPDGSSTWRFTAGTQGEPNDPATYQKDAEKTAEPAPATSTLVPANPQCLGSALCIEGKVIKMVDTDTLYVDSGSQKYKVDLSLTKVSRNDKNYESGSKITRYNCLGGNVLVDQDDGQPEVKKIKDALSIKGVVYCGSHNLNQELLDSGFVGLDYRQCFVSEFASQDWAVRNGCK
ncbi:lamin tail domain-containing protein [Nitrososphaera sp.]|uniref:lamin tail domain-containing protein n=1 Tax=Nitrososphaera sp. TaxID=1971748 RepID=UPI0031805463